MEPLGICITVTFSVLLLLIGRGNAALLLPTAAVCTTLGQTIKLGPFNFNILRLLILVGIVRLAVRREWIRGIPTKTDYMVLMWGILLIFTSTFHSDPSQTLVHRLGLVFDGYGLYFLLRVFISDRGDVDRMVRWIIIILVPLAIAFLFEKWTGRNPYSIFGGVPEFSFVRGDKIRAQGPFDHAILGGTVGAVCLPLAILQWQTSRLLSAAGVAASLIIVYSSSSSGPVVTSMAGVLAMILWSKRTHLRWFLWVTAGVLVTLHVLMKAPIWYLMARIDVVGGSTGYHRAALIDAAVKHIGEWWAYGTDYTRHWMPTGLYITEDHTDITNHYIRMGVMGGLPCMVAFLLIILTAFRRLQETAVIAGHDSEENMYTCWVLGVVLFVHVVTFFSIAFWSQELVFWYSLLAMIGAVGNEPMLEREAIVEGCIESSEGEVL